MTDVFDPGKRRQIMRAVRGKDTTPELTVRRLLHRLGYRYRLDVRELPGRPDLVFPSRNKIIFVHGCFWHRHSCRKGRSMPATRVGFWREKLEANVARDRRNLRKLKDAGWDVFVVWECQISRSKQARLLDRLIDFLES